MTDPASDLWQAWAADRLCVQACSECGNGQHPPGQVCRTCHSTDLALVDIDGTAVLVSWSTVHRAPAPEFAADIPYTVAIVSVDAGALVQARVHPDLPAEALRAGLPMAMTLAHTAGRRIPVVTLR